MNEVREPKLPVTLGDGLFVVRRLRPQGVFCVFRGGMLTAEHAALITENVMPIAAACSERHKLVIVHDWRLMTGYESAARTNLTRWAVNNFRDVHFTGIVIPEGNRIISMGLHVAGSALALAGLQLAIDTSAERILLQARTRLA